MPANNYPLYCEFESESDILPLKLFLEYELDNITTTVNRGIPYKQDLFYSESKNDLLEQDKIEDMIQTISIFNPFVSVDWGRYY